MQRLSEINYTMHKDKSGKEKIKQNKIAIIKFLLKKEKKLRNIK